MSSTLRSTALLCLWPPYERFTIATNKGIQKFLVQDVPGDGSYFFHCLSVAIGGGLADSQMLRNVICGHILQNWRTLASGVSLFHDNITTQQLYSHKMISQNGWATSAEISVAARLLKCQINIWYEVRNRYSIQSFNPDGQPINVLDIRLRNSHFQLLKPFCHVIQVKLL